MKWNTLLSLALLGSLSTASSLDRLEAGFQNPPDSTKPWCYWYWITDNISREGITRDLEAMRDVGIGEAFIGNIYLDEAAKGNVKALTEEWWGMVTHAIREGGRLGVNVGLFNCPGWSQSGGPWITPERSMRYVATREFQVTGPSLFVQRVSDLGTNLQPISILAFPARLEDNVNLFRNAPVSAEPAIPNLRLLADDDPKTSILLPAVKGHEGVTIDLKLASPEVARSLVLVPSETSFSVQCELLTVADGKTTSIKSFPMDRSNTGLNVGFMPHGAVSVSFPAVTSQHFRLRFTGIQGKASLAELRLSPAARVERHIEKQLGKMHPTPLPMFDAYNWPATAPIERPDLAIPADAVRDLSRFVGPDGTFRWQAPPGEWVVLFASMCSTGIKNAPASPEGQGLEVDKMNAAAAREHFNAYIGEVLRRLPANERRAFKRVIADSYEMGSQNWTDGFEIIFREAYGYDPRPWLPTLAGRVVGSPDQSDRFLWDLRRLVADQVSYGYVGGLRKACNEHGLRLWLENYGHWGFPGEFLQYGGQSDDVSGEFWATGDLGSIELRAAASAAHIYGKPIVSAEAFTSTQKFDSTPWSLKKRGDWALTEGVNHWVLHVYIHQPWEDKLPGVNAWFTTEFNRHNTWFFEGREWIDYYRRCQFLLQQGKHVAEVAYFIGEDTPKMTGIRRPDLPPGFNFDYINAEVILNRLKVKDGQFVLPDGMSYQLLVLPDSSTMRPEVLTKIASLVKAGGPIVGNPPSRSPSMENFPAADQRVVKLARDLWGAPHTSETVRTFGKGRVFRTQPLESVLDAIAVAPDVSGIPANDVLWTHRTTGDSEIYFLCNQTDRSLKITPLFRAGRKTPQLWDAVSCRITQPAVYAAEPGGVRLPIDLEPRGSVFAVFRPKPENTPVITRVEKDGVILKTTQPATIAASDAGRVSANNFIMAGWVKPAVDIGLPKQTNTGVFLNEARNDAVAAVHGVNAFGSAEHSGAGISVGRNGVVVYEHTADQFAPLLVHALSITNWTHLAVVFENAKPTLFVNGQTAHEGLRSKYQVHSSVGRDAAPDFKGQLAGFQEVSGSPSALRIAEWAAAKPPESAGEELLALNLTFSAPRTLQFEAAANGSYLLTTGQGTLRKVDVRDLAEPLTFTGEWTVRFQGKAESPQPLELPELRSLSEHENPDVKYFAGTAIYSRQFDLPASRLAWAQRVILDLGQVESIATVTINDTAFRTLWKPPFRLDITEALRPGQNTLRVNVTGTWRNRLMGASAHPEGLAGGHFKPYLTTDLKVPANERLAPFGLLGPVSLINTQRITLAP